MNASFPVAMVILFTQLCCSIQAERVVSLLTQANSIDYSNAVVVSNLLTRTNRGNGGGVVEGVVFVVAGDVIGAGKAPVYEGVNTGSFSDSSQFRDLSRHKESPALVVYDFDISSYLAIHAPGSGDFVYSLDLELEGRRVEKGQNVEFYLSYNNGSSIVLDSTNVSDLVPGSTAVFNTLSADTSRYIMIGSHMANHATGSYSWDITSHISSSKDGKFRLLVKDCGEYLGDLQFNVGSGITATERLGEQKVLGLLTAHVIHSVGTASWY